MSEVAQTAHASVIHQKYQFSYLSVSWRARKPPPAPKQNLLTSALTAVQRCPVPAQLIRQLFSIFIGDIQQELKVRAVCANTRAIPSPTMPCDAPVINAVLPVSLPIFNVSLFEYGVLHSINTENTVITNKR